jgi:sigma-B regulation protein RsbU (phosphoserine phosphatase)
LAICLFLPQRFSLGFISSILTSFFFLIPIILSDPPNEKLVFEGSTYLLAANIFGLITFRELNKYKRRNYLMLLENQNRHEQLRVRHDIMQKDLDLARNVQHKLISKSLPQRNIFTMYHPVEKVGGDLIDVLPITDNITGIFLADVSGHGVSAALVTVLIKAFLNRKLEEFTKDGGASDLFSPSRMLKSLNKNLSPYLGNHFVSAFYATYNHTERRLVYSGAAHPPPMLLVQGETGKPELTFLQMKKQFFPIGYFFQKSLCVKGECEFQINLSPGSRLIFYSDGLFDAINYTYDKSDEGLNSFRGKFIYKNLEEIFNIVPAKWMENFSVDLMEQRENFVEYDDISVVLANIV